MPSQIFINLPVADIGRSKAFFAALGWSFNPQFEDENACCLVLAENIFVMLLLRPYFQSFTPRPVAEAHATTQVLLAIDAGSRSEVDSLVAKAVAAGGSTYRAPDDHGWMYYHSFADLDGHQWEVAYMDLSQMPQG
ncbi:MAG: glyoxalase/bleomycin resistance/extradiol dioxygenase family protein [Bacteroidia bacterium]|nr:glyoxalase/bleomycin resistance/extradiol dioxygenase family protein [Bacteroidia bacterium]